MKIIACAFVKMKAIRDIIALIPAHRQQREEFRDCQNPPVKRAGMRFGQETTVTVADFQAIFIFL